VPRLLSVLSLAFPRLSLISILQVKGVGHCNNNNMSSTVGVQIAMAKFDGLKVDAKMKTVEIGMGLNWGQVFRALDPYNLTVVGGRAQSVGELIITSDHLVQTNLVRCSQALVGCF
jgi:hypothetical protein